MFHSIQSFALMLCLVLQAGVALSVGLEDLPPELLDRVRYYTSLQHPQGVQSAYRESLARDAYSIDQFAYLNRGFREFVSIQTDFLSRMGQDVVQQCPDAYLFPAMRDNERVYYFVPALAGTNTLSMMHRCLSALERKVGPIVVVLTSRFWLSIDETKLIYYQPFPSVKSIYIQSLPAGTYHGTVQALQRIWTALEQTAFARVRDIELEHADIPSASGRHYCTIVLHGPPDRLPYFARYAYLPSADRYVLNAVQRTTPQTTISDYYAQLAPEKEYCDERDLSDADAKFESLQIGMCQERLDRRSPFTIDLRYNGLPSSFAPKLALQGWAPVFRSVLSATRIGSIYRSGATALLLGAAMSPMFPVKPVDPSRGHQFNVVNAHIPFHCQVTHSGDTHTTRFHLTRVPGY